MLQGFDVLKKLAKNQELFNINCVSITIKGVFFSNLQLQYIYEYENNLVIKNTSANPDKNMIPAKLKSFNNTEG